MNITGKTMIFKNDYGYSTTIRNKQQDGTYENMYVSVNFNKCKETENKALIDIKDGFISFYKTKDGLPKIKFIINDYEKTSKEERIPNDEENNFEITSDDDLPF